MYASLAEHEIFMCPAKPLIWKADLWGFPHLTLEPKITFARATVRWVMHISSWKGPGLLLSRCWRGAKSPARGLRALPNWSHAPCQSQHANFDPPEMTPQEVTIYGPFSVDFIWKYVSWLGLPLPLTQVAELKLNVSTISTRLVRKLKYTIPYIMVFEWSTIS